jgi:acid phosphatase
MFPRPRISRALLAPLLAAACTFPSTATAAEGVPAFDHVIVVVMENHAYNTVRVLPYTAGLIAASSSFSSSYGVTHPSQPNYLALWGASTMAVTNDVCPSPGSPYTTGNLGQACEAAGVTWKAYSEALPTAGSTVCTALTSSYTRKHDPWTDWNNLTHSNEVPYEQFALDTAAHALPALAFIVPNNCHNTHDCTPASGDTWLASVMPGWIQAAGPNGLVILTWDEDDSANGNHILTVFAGPRVKPGYVSSRAMTHYTVVRTICAAFGLTAFANAATDSAVTDVWLAPPAAVPQAPVTALRLDAPAPDPSRGEVRATLHLPAAMAVDAAIYDAGGRRVRSVLSGTRSGTVAITWDGRDPSGRDAGSGVFFLRVRAGAQDMTRRLVRVR